MTRSICIIILVVQLAACRERYDVPFTTNDLKILVVEGFINMNGETTMKLSRVTTHDANGTHHERGAVVVVEGEDQTRYELDETGPGTYTSLYNVLNPATKYRINIRTSEGKVYVSEFSGGITTPEIDSLTYKRFNGGVEIYVNAHDAESDTRYYQWSYDETWQIRSVYPTNLVYSVDDNVYPPIFSLSFYDPATRRPIDSMFTCYVHRASSALKIASTMKLTEDRVHVPLVFHPKDTEPIAILYSINVKQRGLTKEAYEFFDIMRKNTETLGTIFDAQPTDLKGNLTCVDNPSEPVVGFVTASTIVEKRMFIRNSELGDWDYKMKCDPEKRIPNINDSLVIHIANEGRYPTGVEIGADTAAVYAAYRQCVDCTTRGTHIKPDFWP